MLMQTPIQRADFGLPNVARLSDKLLQGWSPLMRQYLDLRAKANALLAFQLGDFCEFFFEDAVTVSRILDIRLTSRGSGPDGSEIQMCGVPNPRGLAGSANSEVRYIGDAGRYYAAILQAGYPLAFAVQTGIQGKIMQRDIVARFEPSAQVQQ